MPFTFVHAATAFPLKRFLPRFTSLSALIIGSMSPDFAYYLPLELERHHTHQFTSIFWFCLPTGFLVYVLYHTLWKPGIQYLINGSLSMERPPQDRDASNSGPVRVLVVALSLAAGAMTHIFWDNSVWGIGMALGVPHLPLAILNSLAGFLAILYFVRIQYGSVIGAQLSGHKVAAIRRNGPMLLFAVVIPWVIGAAFGLYRIDWALRLSRAMDVLEWTFFAGVAAAVALITVFGMCVRVFSFMEGKLQRL